MTEGIVPSVLWHLVGHQEEHPACKNWVMRCWCGYLSGARCRLFAYGTADTTASQTPSYLASFKSRLILPFWYQLTQVVLEKRPLSACVHACVWVQWMNECCSNTHTRLTALFPGLPRWAGTRKIKPIWILLKQETVSGISWAICKSALHSRQITTPAPHHSLFYRPDALPVAQPTAPKHWRQ